MTCDTKKLLTALSKHAERTGSATASDLMESPSTVPSKFRVVVPKGFREAQDRADKDRN